MLILGILSVCGFTLLIGGRVYSAHLARVFGEVPNRVTPSQQFDDGIDYVPTKTPIVFAHHFASIAGAGPIVGPIIGLAFGWLPALLWIVMGALFAGAVHDYSATFISVRERGRSIAVIARQTLGVPIFILFILLLIVLLVIVTAMFLILSAQALTSVYPAEKLGIDGPQSILDVDAAGQVMVGGIATTSVIIITAFAPIMGWLYLVRKMPVVWCSVLALIVCAVSVWVGILYPVRIPAEIPWIEPIGALTESQILWMIGLAVYCLLAAGLPVWIFLQSRDFLNVHILYVGIGLMLAALVITGVNSPGIDFPAVRGTSVDLPIGKTMQTAFIWPFMFITIACGACSGFHSLCATGTTSKQVYPEKAARQVGFYAMLLESFLAVCVVCAVLAGLSFADYSDLMLRTEPQPNAVLTFAVTIGAILNAGLAIPKPLGVVFGMLLLEGFVITTLDTAVRLARYLFEELWATLFARFDVFANRAVAAHQSTSATDPEVVPTGAAGLETAVELPHARPTGPIIRTSGIGRLALNVLGHYWFNTALVSALMLMMALTGYAGALWSLFGAGNQLLAGLSLLIASTWLLMHGRSIVYTFVPAALMLVTTLWMLGRSLPTYYSTGAYPLLISDVIILTLTTCILVQSAVRYFSGSLGAGVGTKVSAAGIPAERV